MFNENWNNEVTKSYLNLYNEDGTVANAPVFNKVEETFVEPVQLVENPETEEVIEEETTEEGDFLFSLIEDVQNSIGEELTEQEMQVIFETVALVVEGMVKKMSEAKKLQETSGNRGDTQYPPEGQKFSGKWTPEEKAEGEERSKRIRWAGMNGISVYHPDFETKYAASKAK
jgi:hypothetical protein